MIKSDEREDEKYVLRFSECDKRNMKIHQTHQPVVRLR